MSDPEPIQQVIRNVLIGPQYGGITAAQGLYREDVAPRLARELTAALAENERMAAGRAKALDDLAQVRAENERLRELRERIAVVGGETSLDTGVSTMNLSMSNADYRILTDWWFPALAATGEEVQ